MLATVDHRGARSHAPKDPRVANYPRVPLVVFNDEYPSIVEQTSGHCREINGETSATIRSVKQRFT